MIENYYFYYSYPCYKDTLFVYFDLSKCELDSKKVGNVIARYRKDGHLHSYMICDIGKIIKIKTDGFIFSYNIYFLKAINFMIENAGFETLKSEIKQRYFVGKIVESISPNFYKVKVNDLFYTSYCADNSIRINDLVYIAIENAILSDGSIIKEEVINGIKTNGHICLEKDFNISNKDKLLVVSNNKKEGDALFQVRR